MKLHLNRGQAAPRPPTPSLLNQKATPATTRFCENPPSSTLSAYLMSQTMSRCLCAVFISGFFHVLQLVYYKVLRNHMNSAWFSASKRVSISFRRLLCARSVSAKVLHQCQQCWRCAIATGQELPKLWDRQPQNETATPATKHCHD